MPSAGNLPQTPFLSPVSKDTMLDVRNDPSAQNTDRQGRYSGERTVRKRRMSGSGMVGGVEEHGDGRTLSPPLAARCSAVYRVRHCPAPPRLRVPSGLRAALAAAAAAGRLCLGCLRVEAGEGDAVKAIVQVQRRCWSGVGGGGHAWPRNRPRRTAGSRPGMISLRKSSGVQFSTTRTSRRGR